MRSGKQHGFTLIELMITVAIIGILAAVAYPSYTSYIKKGNRTAAKTQMLDIANRQQQFLLTSRAYADKTALETSGYVLPAEVDGKYTYNIVVGVVDSANPVPSFTITFTPRPGKAQDGDGELILDQDGKKSCAPACNPVSLKW